MSRAKSVAAREKRRSAVLSLHLAGAGSREIGDTLGVSHTTVLNDIKFLVKQWRRENIGAVDVAMMKDLIRIETAISSFWASVTRGDLEAIREFRELVRLRAKIYGYEGLPRYEYDREQGYVQAPGVTVNVLQQQGGPASSDDAVLDSVMKMSDEQLDDFIYNMTHALSDEMSPVIIEGSVTNEETVDRQV